MSVLAAAPGRTNAASDGSRAISWQRLLRATKAFRMIEAMPAILKLRPEARLEIVGGIAGAGFWDNVDELQNTTARDPRLADAIAFTSEITDCALAELPNTASALVMPSLWEGIGLPALEAMSCGTPVLASDRGCSQTNAKQPPPGQ